MLYLPLLVISQPSHLKFSHLDTDHGLSQANVTCVLQDKTGFMWFGTQNGLNRYDGYRITVFRNDAADTGSLSNNYITSIEQDPQGFIWIGTWGGGVDRLDPRTLEFRRYMHRPGKNSLPDDFVSSLCTDHAGDLWIGTETGGLCKMRVSDGGFVVYQHDDANPGSLGDNYVTDVFEDMRHAIWVATSRGGLNRLDPSTGVIRRWLHDDHDTNSLAANHIAAMLEDGQHHIWLGTYGSGLDMLDEATGMIRHYRKRVGDPGSLSINEVLSLAVDEKGNVWVGTENGGLCILDPVQERFITYKKDDIDALSLSNNSIYSIYRDRDDNMWVGTYSGGVNLYSRQNGLFPHYRHGKNENTLSNNNVLTMLEDPDGAVWIGTDGGGLDLFEPATGRFTHFEEDGGHSHAISSNYVTSLALDADGNCWAGTVGYGINIVDRNRKVVRLLKNDPLDSNSIAGNNISAMVKDKDGDMWISCYGMGLSWYHRDQRQFTHFSWDQGQLSSNGIPCLLSDSRGRIWIGNFDKGLDRFDKATGAFRHFKHTASTRGISNNTINDLLEDSHGNIWIATGSGLDKLDPTTDSVQSYFVKDGLPTNTISAVREDRHGNIWVSTQNGVARLEGGRPEITNFGMSDGLQGEDFKIHSGLRHSDGSLYFGGTRGFNRFDPDNIRPRRIDPPLVLTGFQLFMKEVPVSNGRESESPLQRDITFTESVTLSHTSTIISFEFSSLDYTHYLKKEYAYRLKPFDKDWNVAGAGHLATYTNLDPGTYVFEVRGRTSDGQWMSHVASVELVVLPPWWETWWARTLGLLLLAAILYLAYLRRTLVMRRQKIVLEQLVEERTWQAESANRAKSAFLATMSHEIRTPLNGVIGMSALLAQTGMTDEQEEYVTTIKACGESLMSVINDILDFSKVEAGSMELDPRDFNLRLTIEDILDVFAPRAAGQGIELVYEIGADVPESIRGDDVRLRQVLMNLVGNAVKFTQEGEIYLGVQLLKRPVGKEVLLEFEVRDTGIGIAPDKLNRLFKAFSQADSSTTRKYGGTGLGLAISEKLIRLMRGEIRVDSQEGRGSSFLFYIQAEKGQVSHEVHLPDGLVRLQGKRILVADDNPVSRGMLNVLLLKWQLRPLLAESGEEALEILSTRPVDLLITDWYMPEMDGVQLARRVREDYPHLPLVLLSAAGQDAQKRYRELFDAVMHKPVRHHLLQRNLVRLLGGAIKESVMEADVAADVSADAAGATEAGPMLLDERFAKVWPMRILVAEDNMINQQLVRHILGKLGYEPAVVDNGQEAFERVCEGSYDLVLMDVQMPVMDGLEATRAIRERCAPGPSIIALTADAQAEDRMHCLEAGMNDYLSKPLELEKLIGVLRKWAPRGN